MWQCEKLETNQFPLIESEWIQIYEYNIKHDIYYIERN